MESFKDLYIEISREAILGFIDTLTENLARPWERAYENEEGAKDFGETAFCFKRNSDVSLPAAGLSIFQKDPNLWYVPNVVPLEIGQFNYDQYNQIITEFYDKCLMPIASAQNVKVEITSGQLSVEDVVGVDAAKVLRRFSNGANKSTGSSHPSDQKRWFAFIVAASKSNHEIDINDFKRLLKQQGWSEEFATDLAHEFEFGRDLIRYIVE